MLLAYNHLILENTFKNMQLTVQDNKKCALLCQAG